MTERLRTAREVSELLGVSTETVLRWVRDGKLPAIRLPSGAIRFHEDALDAWMCETGYRLPRWAGKHRKRHSSRPSDQFGQYGTVLASDPCSDCDTRCEEVDHIVPRVHRGLDPWTNCTAAGGTCNRSKGARPLLLWMARR